MMEELVFMKMYLFKLYIIISFSLNVQENHGQRRIVGGEPVSIEKRYVVYLLKASASDRNYENWICGGAIVSPDYIVTSAACVTDVMHLYAIAGYNKYISEADIHKDPCTKQKKKKIIFTCTPKDYQLDHNSPDKWSNIDIAMAKVESPYDFADTSYAATCSYTPAAINVNYEAKYQEPGVDAIVLGWGHKTNYRQDMDLENYNQEFLQYGPVLIGSKEECKKEYAVYDGMGAVIDKYMICTIQKGNLNAEGIQILKTAPTAQGCEVKARRLHSNFSECVKIDATEDHTRRLVKIGDTRKNIKPTILTVNETEQKLKNPSNSRRSDAQVGICQNDHGGPLVTWIGAHEVLIGVASTFKISESLECIGPYLYTSTQCNGAFLDCILASDPSKTDKIRRAICKNMVNEMGYELVEKHISWMDHPDGPADNERNITTHASVKNTTNGTLNLQNSKEEENKTDQVQNITKLVTNTNDTTPTLSTDNSTLTRTTKADNVGDSTPINLTKTNTTKTTKSATVMSSSDSSVPLENDRITNETSMEQPTNHPTKKSHSIASKNYIFKDTDGRVNTVLFQTETNTSSTTTKKVTVTTTVDVKTTKTTHVVITPNAPNQPERLTKKSAYLGLL